MAERSGTWPEKARRPHLARLTEFYICLSAGGAAGGIFNALLAQILFNWTYEYEIGLTLARAIRFSLPRASRFRPAELAIPALILGLSLAAPPALAHQTADMLKPVAAVLTLLVLAVLLVLGLRRPAGFTASAAAVLAGLAISSDTAAQTVMSHK